MCFLGVNNSVRNGMAGCPLTVFVSYPAKASSSEFSSCVLEHGSWILAGLNWFGCLTS